MIGCKERPTKLLPNAVKVTVSIGRAIVVNDDIDTLNVNTTSEDIGGHEDTLLECLEGRVTRNATKKLGIDDDGAREATYRSS
jgi:hypothetical protein